MARSSSARSRANGSSKCVSPPNAATATSSAGDNCAARARAARFISARSGSTLGLESINKTRLAGSSEASKCTTFCSTPSSNTRNASAPSPRTCEPSARKTLQFTSTRLTCARIRAALSGSAADSGFAPRGFARSSPAASRRSSKAPSRRFGLGSFPGFCGAAAARIAAIHAQAASGKTSARNWRTWESTAAVSIDVEIADRLFDRFGLRFLQRFFKLSRENVFLFLLRVPRLAELVLAALGLLTQQPLGVSQVHIRQGPGRQRVGKHHGELPVNLQLGLAA